MYIKPSDSLTNSFYTRRSIFEKISTKKVEKKDEVAEEKKKDEVDPLEAYMKTIEKAPDQSSSSQTISMEEIMALSTSDANTNESASELEFKETMLHSSRQDSDSLNSNLPSHVSSQCAAYISDIGPRAVGARKHRGLEKVRERSTGIQTSRQTDRYANHGR